MSNWVRLWPLLILIVLVLSMPLVTIVSLGGEITPGEDMCLSWFHRVSSGGSLYQASSGFIEGVTPAYSPLYYVLVGNLMKVWDSPLVGRVVSFLGFLVVLIFTFLIVKRYTWLGVFGIVAVLLVVLHPVLRSSSTTLRQDTLALAFSVVGIYLAFIGRIWWSIPLFLAAVFTKQSAIAAPIATALYLLLGDNPRQGLKWCVVLGLLGILSFFLVNYMTVGEFYRHAILYPIQSGAMIYTWQHVLVALLFLVVPLAFSILYIFRYREFELPEVYLMCAFSVMLLTIGKEGAGINYSFEVLVASSILMVFFFFRLIISREVSWRVKLLGH